MKTRGTDMTQAAWTLRRFLGMGAGIAGASLLAMRLIHTTQRDKDLQGKVALVTGGSRGFGLILARQLAEAGCRVAICARDEEELQRARQELQESGEVFTIVADVGKREEAQRLVAEVEQRFGRIDVLVNNAGVVQVGPHETMRIEDYETAMDVMYWGVVHPTLAALPGMKGRGEGRIVNITSIGGKVAAPHLLPYDSAKFAAVGFSEGLATELGGTGVSVTTIVPNLMRTGGYHHVAYKGQAREEASWFGLASALPLITISPERAARDTVRALKQGRPERVLGMPARVLMWTHGLAPNVTTRLMQLFKRVALPSSDGGSRRTLRGSEALPKTAAYRKATTLGRRAAARYNQ